MRSVLLILIFAVGFVSGTFWVLTQDTFLETTKPKTWPEIGVVAAREEMARRLIAFDCSAKTKEVQERLRDKFQGIHPECRLRHGFHDFISDETQVDAYFRCDLEDIVLDFEIAVSRDNGINYGPDGCRYALTDVDEDGGPLVNLGVMLE